MIFQEPMTSLNPVFTVGEQVMEAIRLHEDISKEPRERTISLFDEVGIRTRRVASTAILTRCSVVKTARWSRWRSAQPAPSDRRRADDRP